MTVIVSNLHQLPHILCCPLNCPFVMTQIAMYSLGSAGMKPSNVCGYHAKTACKACVAQLFAFDRALLVQTTEANILTPTHCKGCSEWLPVDRTGTHDSTRGGDNIMQLRMMLHRTEQISPPC